MKSKGSVFFYIGLVIGVASVSSVYLASCKAGVLQENASDLNTISISSPDSDTFKQAIAKQQGVAKKKKLDDDLEELQVVGFSLAVGAFNGEANGTKIGDVICHFPPKPEDDKDLCVGNKPGGGPPISGEDGKGNAGKSSDNPPPKPGGSPAGTDAKLEPNGGGAVQGAGGGVKGYLELDPGIKQLADVKVKSGYKNYCALLEYWCTTKKNPTPRLCLAHPGNQTKAPCGTPQNGSVTIPITVNWHKNFGGEVQSESGIIGLGEGQGFVNVNITATIGDTETVPSSSSDSKDTKKEEKKN